MLLFLSKRESSFWRAWVATVTVGALDSAIETVNHELCLLVLADFASCVNCLFFRVIVTAGALCSAFSYVPTAIWVVNNVMSRSRHGLLPPVSFRAAGGAAIRVPIDRFCFLDGVDLVREIADIGLASNSKPLRMILRVYLVMQARVVSLVIIDVVKLIHEKILSA